MILVLVDLVKNIRVVTVKENKMESFDLIVVGAGPGGYVAAIRAAQLGFNTAIVERDALGGVCLNWGCIPTKALLKSAQALKYAKSAETYGLSVGDVQIDIAKVVERSRGVSAQMSKGVEFLMKKNKITVILGSATLKKDNVVEVCNAETSIIEEYTAKHIILATGARANSLPFAPIDGEKIISYRQALVPNSIPESMAIIGSGAIGSEFACFYHTMGVKNLYLIEYIDRIVPLEDEEVSAQLSRSFRKAGIKVMVSSQVKSANTSEEGVVLEVVTKKGVEQLKVDKVLSAVGVIPNTDSLGLEELGVEMERGRIKVDEFYRSSVNGIYAIGDIIPTPALAHVASAEGICCVEHIAGVEVVAIDYSNIPGCTYTFPEIGSVGLTEAQAKEQGVNYKIGKFPFTASGKAASAGEKDGFVKLITDADSDKLLGAHLIGSNVTEMISGLVVAKKAELTAKDILKTIHPHPSMSEAIMEAAAIIHNEVIHL